MRVRSFHYTFLYLNLTLFIIFDLDIRQVTLLHDAREIIMTHETFKDA